MPAPRPALLALVACGACRGVFGIEDPVPIAGDAAPDAAGAVDAAQVDAPPPDAMTWCFTEGLDLCVATPPAPAPAGRAVWDSDADCHVVVPAPTVATGARELCVLLFESVSWTAPASVRLIGSRPLVIAATGAIIINNDLDAASGKTRAISPRGAGGGDPRCTFSGAPGAGTTSGGGGAGGSFGSTGGNGGTGGTTGMGVAGLSGPTPTNDPTDVRGGCDGQGGEAPGGAVGGAGGEGGGAVWLLSQTSITIGDSSDISAGGGGGRGGAVPYGGGGGGGAGGTIGLGAPMVTVRGTLTANGAGGGGGAGNEVIQIGDDGEDARTALTSAVGGQGGGSTGGRGGRGAANLGTGEVGQAALDGAGGGGGGSGRVYIGAPQRSLGSGEISPPATIVP